MPKKLSVLAASIVAFAFVFVSITHACSGLTSLKRAMQQSPMNMGASDAAPCGKEKPDICKSVRDSMLSVKPSVSGVDSPEKMASTSPISFASLILHGAPPVAFVTKVSFHPVFKLPLTFSYLVLRI